MAPAATSVSSASLKEAPTNDDGATTAASASELAPVIVVGAGLSGLVAAYEIIRTGRKVVIVEQEPEQFIGGQAHWSLGGLFFVNSPEQRRLGIHDSEELALQDWLNSAQFDNGQLGQGIVHAITGAGADEARLLSKTDVPTDPRGHDYWGLRWAQAFVHFAATEFRDYMSSLGMGLMPHVGWAERGSGLAGGHGNSVPRFHIAWGTGPEVVRVFREPVVKAAEGGLVEFRWRHRVDDLVVDGGRVVGVRGKTLAPDMEKPIGSKTNRDELKDFEVRGRAVVVASGGIGHNIDLLRKAWPEKRMGGPFPSQVVFGVPFHVDGRMLAIANTAGARLVNEDRMWFYTEGLHNWNSIWPEHGIRVIPGPSSLWLDATGKRFGSPAFPGCDSLATLKSIVATGYDYSWFLLDKATIIKEFVLSGSEQNPDITSKSILRVLKERLGGRGIEPVHKFVEHGADFITRDTLPELVEAMNALAQAEAGTSGAGKAPPTIDYDDLLKVIKDRDAQIEHPYSKDSQAMLIQNARNYWPDKYMRVVRPHRLLDPATTKKDSEQKPRSLPGLGPLIAVRMAILTRKTLGGIQTNLDGRVVQADGQNVLPGLYAAGEANGFGGGGVHGYNALEGTFLGGCIFSGRTVGRTLAKNDF